MAIHHQPEMDGSTSWQVASAAFLATFTVFGVAYSFGAFFGPMADEFGTDRGTTAFFFSITTFLYFGLGVATGHIADRRGPRPVLLVGAVFLVLGLLATSRVSSIWLGYLTYGVGVGIGVACAYVPMVAAVGGWFEQKRTTALGFAVAGIGVGTLTVAPLAEWLIERYGWRQSYVILAVGSTLLLAITSLGAHRPPQQVEAGAPSPLGNILRSSWDFRILYLAMALISMALFVPFVFLPDYLETNNISGPAGWLIGLIGIASVVGRLGLGALASRFSSMVLYRGSFIVLSLSFIIWLAAGSSYAALLVFALILGVSYGGFIALSPAVTAELFGAAGLGAILGALYTAAGIGGLLGPPLTGWLIDTWSYSVAILVAMGLSLAGGLVLLTLGRSTPSIASEPLADPEQPAELAFESVAGTLYDTPRPRDPRPPTVLRPEPARVAASPVATTAPAATAEGVAAEAVAAARQGSTVNATVGAAGPEHMPPNGAAAEGVTAGAVEVPDLRAKRLGAAATMLGGAVVFVFLWRRRAQETLSDLLD